MPLAAVFGIAVWVYQMGALDWLPGGPGHNPFTSPKGGLAKSGRLDDLTVIQVADSIGRLQSSPAPSLLALPWITMSSSSLGSLSCAARVTAPWWP